MSLPREHIQAIINTKIVLSDIYNKKFKRVPPKTRAAAKRYLKMLPDNYDLVFGLKFGIDSEMDKKIANIQLVRNFLKSVCYGRGNKYKATRELRSHAYSCLRHYPAAYVFTNWLAVHE